MDEDYKSRVDGLEIPAYLFAPLVKQPGKHAALVWVHGGVHSNWSPNMWPFVKEAVVVGKGRSYLTAMLNIDMGVVGKWAEERALAYATLVTPWRRQYFVGSPLSGRIAALHVVTDRKSVV